MVGLLPLGQWAWLAMGSYPRTKASMAVPIGFTSCQRQKQSGNAGLILASVPDIKPDSTHAGRIADGPR